jgi:hypothetical protein
MQLGCVVKNMYRKLPYYRRKEPRKTMSERSESKRLGAKQHKNSGRGTKKGDATWEDFIVDFKEASKSFTLNESVWGKIVTDSILSGTDKSPALIVVLGEGKRKVRLAIVELALLEQMLEELNGRQDDTRNG